LYKYPGKLWKAPVTEQNGKTFTEGWISHDTERERTQSRVHLWSLFYTQTSQQENCDASLMIRVKFNCSTRKLLKASAKNDLRCIKLTVTCGWGRTGKWCFAKKTLWK